MAVLAWQVSFGSKDSAAARPGNYPSGGWAANRNALWAWVLTHIGWGVYCATKFAVEGISEAFSDELRPLGIHSTIIEPGVFRTDFLSAASLVPTKARIDDYAETVGEVRKFAAGADHKQPGDPKKLSQAIMRLVDSPKPPVRLALGSDIVARIRSKNQVVESELTEWLDLALSTDHDDGRKRSDRKPSLA